MLRYDHVMALGERGHERQPGACTACAVQNEEGGTGTAAHQADGAAAQREPGGGGDRHCATFVSVSCTASCMLARKPARADRCRECKPADRLACLGAAALVSPAEAAETEAVAAAGR